MKCYIDKRMKPSVHHKGNLQGVLCTQTPHNACGSPSQFFYSIETGPVHSIFLSNYHDYTTGSDQARRRIPQPSPESSHARWFAAVATSLPWARCCMVHRLADCRDMKAFELTQIS